MFNLFEKLRSSHARRPIDKATRENFVQYFYSQSEHAWILESQMFKMHFDQVLRILPLPLIDYFFKHPLCFVTSDMYRKTDHFHQLKNTIVIFPEYKKMLARDNAMAQAFLVHELAFVLYELESEQQDPLMAEVEADKFVCDLGLATELEDFLLAMDESDEKRLRLTYLTIKAFSSN